MSQPVGCKLADGRLCFPTTLGVVAIDPSSVSKNNLPPPVAIERFLVDDQTFAEGPVFEQPLTIAPGRHHLEFQFTALSFVTPEKVLFKYRLSGPDRDWINAGNRRNAVYSFLPPGHYNFQLKACNNDGIWNETGTSLEFVILPYFWETSGSEFLSSCWRHWPRARSCGFKPASECGGNWKNWNVSALWKMNAPASRATFTTIWARNSRTSPC